MKDKKQAAGIILENLKAQLQTIRDLKAISKSSTKQLLTKIEKHVGLSTQLTKELQEKL
jgi:predicted acetyltransferase